MFFRIKNQSMLYFEDCSMPIPCLGKGEVLVKARGGGNIFLDLLGFIGINTSSVRYSLCLRSCSSIISFATKFAVLHVSCITL
jgi:hypothetical protein